MLDNQRKCKICKSPMTFYVGGFNNYARRGICNTCHGERKTKVCKGACKEERPIEEFDWNQSHTNRNARCRTCLTEEGRVRTSKKVKVKTRVVGETDANLANDLTRMKW